MPLDLVLDESNIGKIDDEFRLYQEESLTNTKESNFAVLQSIADLQPDVDALYRLIRGTPFSFTRPEIEESQESWFDDLYKQKFHLNLVPMTSNEA